MMERRLDREEAASAADIQLAVDQMAAKGGGRLVLPAMELVLDRGLALRSGVELVGQGEETVLRKGPGRVYPLTGYHNYGMEDVPLRDTTGLAVGMTVSVHDDHTHGGFDETFATITWIDGEWVGLDRGIEADYQAEAKPCLTTVYPLVFGDKIAAAALRDMRLEGNSADSDKGMGGCRGGAVYFSRSRDIEISGIVERDYRGEGLSFQMCSQVQIVACRFDENSGNGLHPGAGSTKVRFEDCVGSGNQRSGFFFCVRANHIDVRRCSFTNNSSGISIGTRDCNNLIEDCSVENNSGPGVLVRSTPRPTEVHSCLVDRCRIRGNGAESGLGQVEIRNDARDLAFTNNQLGGGTRPLPGFWVEDGVSGLFLRDNSFADCSSPCAAAAASLTEATPTLAVGWDAAARDACRHLGS